MANAAMVAGARALWPQLQAAGKPFGVSPELLAAVAWQESRFQPGAYNAEGDGSNPSRGMMQIRQSTARGLGFTGDVGRLFETGLSLELGAKLLRENLNRVASANPGLPAQEMLDRAISAYNAGWSTIRKGDAPRSGSGEFVNLRAYVEPIRAYYQDLRAAGLPGSLSTAGTSSPASPGSPSSPASPATGVNLAGSGGLFAGLAILGAALVFAADRRRDQ